MFAKKHMVSYDVLFIMSRDVKRIELRIIFLLCVIFFLGLLQYSLKAVQKSLWSCQNHCAQKSFSVIFDEVPKWLVATWSPCQKRTRRKRKVDRAEARRLELFEMRGLTKPNSLWVQKTSKHIKNHQKPSKALIFDLEFMNHLWLFQKRQVFSYPWQFERLSSRGT